MQCERNTWTVLEGTGKESYLRSSFADVVHFRQGTMATGHDITAMSSSPHFSEHVVL